MSQVRRRKFLFSTVAILSSPIAAFAQPSPGARRIGFLAARARPNVANPDPHYSAFVRGLQELGYYEGKNLAIEWRYADGNYERLPALAAELAALDLEVLVTHATPPALALHKATQSVPIVAIAVADPVRNGLTASLSRPSANITGLVNLFDDVSPKQVELLKAIVPSMSRAAVLLNKSNPANLSVLDGYLATAKEVRVTTVLFDANTADGIEQAFAAMPQERVEALIVIPDAYLAGQRGQIAALAIRYRLPSMAPFVDDVLAGALLSYGASIADVFRRGATYVDKILKGAKPGDLPFEQPTSFELVINMRTAKALGIKIPQSVLLRASRVIE